jgi:cupin 2 domain-containing protein
MSGGNLFEAIPPALPEELVTVLARAGCVRVERIVSRGQSSPPGFWYDQDVHEFVLLVAGRARLMREGESEMELRPGDWIEFRAHVRHRVTFTAPDEATIWLAVFYGD